MDDQEFNDEIDCLLDESINGESVLFCWFQRKGVRVTIHNLGGGDVAADALGCVRTIGGTIAEAMRMMIVALEARD